MTKEIVESKNETPIRDYMEANNVLVDCSRCCRQLPITDFWVASDKLLNSSSSCKECITKKLLYKKKSTKLFETTLATLLQNNADMVGEDTQVILDVVMDLILVPQYVVCKDTQITFKDVIKNAINSLNLVMYGENEDSKFKYTIQRIQMHTDIANAIGRPDLIHRPVGGKRTKTDTSNAVENELPFGIPVEKATKYQHIVKNIDPNPNNISIDLKDRIAQNAPGAKEESTVYVPSEEDTVALLGGEQAAKISEEMYDEAVLKKLKIAGRQKEFAEYIKSFNCQLTLSQIKKANNIISNNPTTSDAEIVELIETT